MTEAELKANKEKPEKIIPTKMIDLSKAERVFVDKEEIKRREQEAEMSKMSEV
jgi:hypothetical protein